MGSFSWGLDFSALLEGLWPTWAQTDGFGVSTQFLCIYSDMTTALQTHPAPQELQHQANFSALTCMPAALQRLTHRKGPDINK